MLNKPKETITTLSDEKNRNTVKKWLPKSYENIRFVPIGRLDRDTSGLLLFTNDLSWIHPLTHPSYEHKHKYEITIDGLLYEQDYKSIKAGRHPKTGVPIPYPIPILEYLDYDKHAKHARLAITCNNIESKYMFDIFDFVGLPIIGTKHVEFGPIKLHKLKIGEWRELTLPEIHQLKHSCKSIEKTHYDQKQNELPNELFSSNEHISDINSHLSNKQQQVNVVNHKNKFLSSKKPHDTKITANKSKLLTQKKIKNNEKSNEESIMKSNTKINHIDRSINNKSKLFTQKKSTNKKSNEKSHEKKISQTNKSLFHKITSKKTFLQKKSIQK